MNGWTPFKRAFFYGDKIRNYFSDNLETDESVVIGFIHEKEKGKKTRAFGHYWAADPCFLTKTRDPAEFSVPEHLTKKNVRSLTSGDIETILTDQHVRTRHLPAPPGGPSGPTVGAEFKEDD